jgi:site-specific DNA recombinase
MPRAVIYCRVSSPEQTKNLSLPTQEKACREYCFREGYEIAGIFIEEGESAKTANRTKLKELITFCSEKKNRVDVLVVNSVSRFSRDRFAHVTVRALLSKRGITLRSATEPVDDSPAGKLVEGILSTIAQFENDEKAERTKRGMKAALERGTWPFPTTLGYTKIPQADGRSKIIQDPTVAPLIKQAFEMFASGRYDRVEVLRIVSAAGLLTKKGKNLSPQSFCGLLKNPFYAGKLLVKGWEIHAKGAFEPIVTEETFRAAQAILSGRRPSMIQRRRSHPDFPLRHFVKCGACERPLTGSYSSGRNNKYGYYHCANGSCRSRNIPRQDLEREFLRLIEQLQPKAEYLDLFREIVLDVWKERRKETIKLVTTLESRITELKAKRQKLIEAFVYKHSIEKSVYQEQFELLENEIALVELDAYDAKLEDLNVEAALNYATDALRNAARFWIQCSADQKQNFQRVLFPKGLVFEGEGYRTAPTCIAFSYLKGISEGKSSLASRTGIEPVSPP